MLSTGIIQLYNGAGIHSVVQQHNTCYHIPFRFIERHHWPSSVPPDRRTTYVICAGSGSEMIAAMREAHNVIGVDYSNTMHQAQNVRITQFFDGERARAAVTGA